MIVVKRQIQLYSCEIYNKFCWRNFGIVMSLLVLARKDMNIRDYPLLHLETN